MNYYSTFGHHIEKTHYVHKLLAKGGAIPVVLIVYKIGLTIVDSQEKTAEIDMAHARIVSEMFKHLRPVLREIEKHKITHWHQITNEQEQVYTLKELKIKKRFYIQNSITLEPR